MDGDFHLCDWLVQPRLGRASCGNQTVRLRARVMDLLVCLARQPGEVLSKDRIFDEIWKTKFVSESALTRVVSDLRHALQDHINDPTVIETIPKRGYRLIAPVSPVANSPRNGRPRVESLAVLPLANLMGSADHECYVAAVHEALIGELGQIDGLTVISRTSMTRYRNTDRPACEIARELNVDALIEGSMFKAGNMVRIQLQLIRVKPLEHQVWSRAYEDELERVMGVPRKVADAVAEQIEGRQPELARVVISREAPPETL